jgi:APA family basic amino acid/polyamine antiporter
VCMLKMRREAPDHPRLFRAPWAWFIGPLAIVGCSYLFVSLPFATMWRFFVWNAIGLAVYFLYARHASRLAQ